MANPTYSDHITNVRNATREFIAVINKYRALSRQSVALDLPNVMTADDFAGENANILPADLTAVIGTTLSAIEALLAAGHATNLYKVV